MGNEFCWSLSYKPIYRRKNISTDTTMADYYKPGSSTIYSSQRNFEDKCIEYNRNTTQGVDENINSEPAVELEWKRLHESDHIGSSRWSQTRLLQVEVGRLASIRPEIRHLLLRQTGNRRHHVRRLRGACASPSRRKRHQNQRTARDRPGWARSVKIHDQEQLVRDIGSGFNRLS